ncbi:MAG: segregation/condensation protein A [Phycisphaerae bacterium]|nr:segregation/condensation protein A [Phycisphaerae bacterium]
MTEYRVNLDVYNGPLDLLLYLIRRDELDIYDIPIAHVTEQYLRYVEMIKGLDPNLAGEFLVLAATLMEIKTRMLLLGPAPEEGEPAGLAIDPRAELVKQLLQYKAFTDVAGDLRESADLQALKFPRPAPEGSTDRAEIPLEDVQVWDLVDAFGKLMEAIGHRPAPHEVIYDDTPLELHATDILDRLQREAALTFQRVFEGRTLRSEIVGLFLALLELVRRKKVRAAQDANFGQIVITLCEPPGEPPGEPAAPSAPAAATGAAPQPAAPAEEQGQYLAERDNGRKEELDGVG